MVLDALQMEVNASFIDALIHFGDFAYDLRDNGGINGDTFMNRIQLVAAKVLMKSPTPLRATPLVRVIFSV